MQRKILHDIAETVHRRGLVMTSPCLRPYNVAVKIISLQSGSNGNCIYVEAGDQRLLFDAGRLMFLTFF